MVIGFDQNRIGQVMNGINRLKDNDQADVIFFYSDYPHPDIAKWVTTLTKRKVRFISIGQYFHSFPDGFDPLSTAPSWQKRSKWGYHRMIQFWFRDVFGHPCLSDVKYLMRLDDDSCLLSDWPNVFEEMQRKKAVYAASYLTYDKEIHLSGEHDSTS